MPEAPKYESLDAFDLTLDEKNKRKLQLIEELTSNADQVQKRVLEEILIRNADVEYLRRHDLNGRTDRETFKNVMPVITYEDIQPEINRIANGDKSPILSSKPISEFLTRFVINILSSSSSSSSSSSKCSVLLCFCSVLLCFTLFFKNLTKLSICSLTALGHLVGRGS